jgi:integrase
MSTIKCHIDRREIDKAIKFQRAKRSKITLVDPTGLRLAINNASASWNCNYRRRGVDFNGKRHPQRTLKLGDLSALTPNAARLKMEEIKAEVRNGGDPAKRIEIEKRKSREQEFKDRSLSVWLEEYRHNVLGTETKYKNTEFQHARLALQELNVFKSTASVLTVPVLRKLEAIHREKPATGRQRFGSLSRFIDFLVSEDVLLSNPAKNVPRWQRPKMPPPREVVYNLNELRQLWSPQCDIREDYLNFVRFMMLMPLRAGEAANLTNNNVFVDEKELRFSSQETKNDQYFVLPLTDLGLKLIDADNIKNKNKIFHLSSRENEPMKAWSYFNKKVREASDVAHFNLHNFRRTFSSLISEHTDFSESLVDSLLNHKRSQTRQGVIRHYQHAKNVKQRREVMDWWNNFLEEEVVNA